MPVAETTLYEFCEDKIYTYIVSDTGLKPHSVVQTVALFEDGSTVPFIARYRKERTGGLDETQIRLVEQKWNYYTELEKRKEFVVKSINDQGKMTDQLLDKIATSQDRQSVEDLYLPYKPRKRTKATIAKEKGLEPLADMMLDPEGRTGNRDDILTQFINVEKGVHSIDEALAGARDIIAERICDDADIRGWIRTYLSEDGYLMTKARSDWKEKKSKYEMYYDFEEPIEEAASHRVLAIRRGATENVLSWNIDIPMENIIDFIERRLIVDKADIFVDDVKEAIRGVYKRFMMSLETEVFTKALEKAEAEAISVFAKNLHNLLLDSPAGGKTILGIDPGFRTGCKVAVIDENGVYKEYAPIYPHPPQSDEAGAGRIIVKFLEKYNIGLIAVGNGTASRETYSFVKYIINARKEFKHIRVVMVSEAGASVYSASPVAIEEFKDLDVTVRGAISIARRLQDPLAELVKVDAKSIGVGQYQHDVNQTRLKESLDAVVESCVNFVGVELNTASKELLSYVSGIGPVLAKNIIRYRDKNGAFAKRKELLKVTKLGAKAFEQCAGFLRIRDSKNILDNSAIHPERYKLVQQMAKDLDVTVDALIGNNAILNKIDISQYVSDDLGEPTLNDIISELRKPGRDPRSEFVNVEFREDVHEVEDLEEGMELMGKVTNVANFGAFVDIGVHQDGLIHISKLSDSFVKNPHDVIAVGDRVRVKVLSVDTELNRISLERIS